MATLVLCLTKCQKSISNTTPLLSTSCKLLCDLRCLVFDTGYHLSVFHSKLALLVATGCNPVMHASTEGLYW